MELIIIIIIIIGVLTFLALPRLINIVESSRSVEVLSAFSSIRKGFERCYLMNNGTFDGCMDYMSHDFSGLGMDNPENSPGAHFTYKGFVSISGEKEGWAVGAMRVNGMGDLLYGAGCYFMTMGYGIKSYDFYKTSGFCNGYYDIRYDGKYYYDGQKEVSGFLPKTN